MTHTKLKLAVLSLIAIAFLVSIGLVGSGEDVARAQSHPSWGPKRTATGQRMERFVQTDVAALYTRAGKGRPEAMR